jgi:hypothetical protein
MYQSAGEISPCFGKGFYSEALLQDHFGIVMSDINLKQSLQGHDSSAMSDFHWNSNLGLWIFELLIFNERNLHILDVDVDLFNFHAYHVMDGATHFSLDLLTQLQHVHVLLNDDVQVYTDGVIFNLYLDSLTRASTP